MDDPLVRGVLLVLMSTALAVGLCLLIVQIIPMSPRVKSILRLAVCVGGLLALMRLLGAF